MDCLQFNESELGQSLEACKIGEESEEFIVLGTANVIPSEDEPKSGRIITCTVEAGKIIVVHSFTTTGSVYSIATLGEHLVAAVNSSIILLSWTAKSKTLHTICSHKGFILALRLVVCGELIIVADLMKSIICLVFDTVNQKFVEKARDYETNWMTSIEAVSDEIFLGSETNRNILVWKKVSGINADQSRRLETVGVFHLGENINRIRKGSLVIKNQSQLSVAEPKLLYCTTEGSIGVIATVRPESHSILASLETAMERVLSPLGGFSHKEFSNFNIGTDNFKTKEKCRIILAL